MLGIHHLDGYLADATFFISKHEQYSKSGEEKWDAWRPVLQSLSKKMREIYPTEESGWSWEMVDERAAEIREYLDCH